MFFLLSFEGLSWGQLETELNKFFLTVWSCIICTCSHSECQVSNKNNSGSMCDAQLWVFALDPIIFV